MKSKPKTYIEDIKTLKWMEKNVPKMKESEWIRSATAEKIKSKKK